MRIELPVDHLPIDYVESERLRLEMYRRLAEVRSDEDVDELRAELLDRYGTPPPPTEALLAVARFRIACRRAGLAEVMTQGNYIRFGPVNGRLLPSGERVDLPESRQLRLKRMHPGTLLKDAANVALVPRPKTQTMPIAPIEGLPLLEWATGVVEAVFAARPSGRLAISRLIACPAGIPDSVVTCVERRLSALSGRRRRPRSAWKNLSGPAWMWPGST